MESRAVYGYVYVGTAIRYLMDIDRGGDIFKDGGIKQNIEGLLDRLNEYEFHVTLRAIWQLRKMSTSWDEELTAHAEDSQWIKERKLTDAEHAQLIAAAHIGRETLMAEAGGKFAYIASDKRYTVERLVGGVSELFGAGVYQSLTPLAQYDFQESGKAIAFELPTAAAFHILRGTEAVLRDTYTRIVKRNRIPEPRMWAAMVSDLKQRRDAPPEVLLNNLDSLRKHFRNPTQHPEKTYDLDEAQDLFALATDAVSRMSRLLAERSR